jgi:hypothetical protein
MTSPTPTPFEPRDLGLAADGTSAPYADGPFSPIVGGGDRNDVGEAAADGRTPSWPGGSMAYRPATEPGGDGGDGGARPGPDAAPGGDPVGPVAGSASAPGRVQAPAPPRRTRGLVALATAAVIAVLGLPLGWLWSSVAPWLPGVIESDGLFLAQPYGEQRAGQETWFMMLSIGAGIVIAIIAWLTLRRFRGALTVVALAVGGIGASWLAWRFGHNIGRGHALELARHGKIGQIVQVPPDLRIKQAGNIAFWHGLPYVSGALLYLAIAAIFVYVLIAAFTANAGLIPGRRDPEAAAPRPS